MFAFYTSLSKRAKYSKLWVFLTDLESETQWGRDHRNLREAFVYNEFDVQTAAGISHYLIWNNELAFSAYKKSSMFPLELSGKVSFDQKPTPVTWFRLFRNQTTE